MQCCTYAYTSVIGKIVEELNEISVQHTFMVLMATVSPSQPDTTFIYTSTDETTRDAATTGSTYAATITTTTETVLPIRAKSMTTPAAIITTPNVKEQHFSLIRQLSLQPLLLSQLSFWCLWGGNLWKFVHLCRETEDEKSAKCFCWDGYVLAEDEKTCDDVDKHSDGSNGGCGVYCWNVPSSFQWLCSKGIILEENRSEAMQK